jgi:sugar (pentulose or hexulose) kinase
MTGVTRGHGAYDAPFVLAIDVGSSSVKAALFDSRARTPDRNVVRVDHRIHPTPVGGVEEAPDHLHRWRPAGPDNRSL